MKYSFLIMIVLCLCLSACGSNGVHDGGLTPMPPNKNDPKDSVLINNIEQFLARKGAPAHSQYDFVRVDINNDRLRDGIVLFKIPYSYWCGWSGCGMAIFKAGDNSFSFVSDMMNIRGPIYIGPAQTNNYHDIVVRLSGTNMPDKNIMMKYDGKNYPKNPLTEPELPSYVNIKTYQQYLQ